MALKEVKGGSGRPNDLPIGGVAPANSTFGSRGEKSEPEADEAEVEEKKVGAEKVSNKAVQAADTK